jgi:hypothetical protein
MSIFAFAVINLKLLTLWITGQARSINLKEPDAMDALDARSYLTALRLLRPMLLTRKIGCHIATEIFPLKFVLELEQEKSGITYRFSLCVVRKTFCVLHSAISDINSYFRSPD